MKIRIKVFANVREAFGFDERELTVSEGISVREVILLLKNIHAKLNDLNGPLFYAINEEYCMENAILTDKDTLAIFPKVSGG
jgi:molybdopterin converting factor small subunit